MFNLHNQLEQDTFLIGDLKLCQVLLMNNSFYPWFILVPKQADLVEIIDLSPADQIVLMREISLISKIIRERFNPTKLNIAALGNMVPQLHIHIIARFKDDKTFPKPVWISGESEKYQEDEMEKIIQMMSDEIKNYFSYI
jgi:diadenosine tetraphosphate (Ap4A) HIT family hydrolase